jgi:hypothetical protein
MKGSKDKADKSYIRLKRARRRAAQSCGHNRQLPNRCVRLATARLSGMLRGAFLPRAEPDFRAKLGGIVNVESLIELFGLIPDGANL